MKRNKNLIKIIICNVLIVIILILVAELCCIFKESYQIANEAQNEHRNIKETGKNILLNISYSYMVKKGFDDFEKIMRKPAIPQKTNSLKKQIIISGCSFGYGYLLDEKDCIHTILSNMTGRTVSNISIPSGSQRETLWLFSNKETLDRHIVKNQDVDFIIYIYIPDHKRRLFYDLNQNAPQYKITKKNTEIVFLNYPLYSHSFLYRNLKLAKYYLTPHEKISELRNLFFREINKRTKKLYPNSQFVIINYCVDNDDNNDKLDVLEKDGIKIINLVDSFENEMTKKENLASDNAHPNGNMWRKVAKKIITDLNL